MTLSVFAEAAEILAGSLDKKLKMRFIVAPRFPPPEPTMTPSG
jgi:hypothetical protein